MKDKNNKLNLRTLCIIAGGFLVFLAVLNVLTSLVDETSSVEKESPWVNLLSLIDVANITFKATICVGISYLVIKLFFRNTLAKHIGDTFDEGWSNLPKSKRTLAVLFAYIALFLAASNLASGKTSDVLPVSQESLDLITKYEVGGESYYKSRLSRPTVPAWQTTSSGVTVGFGFDVGYNSKSQIQKACQGILTSSEIKALQSVSGLKGRRAYYALSRVKYKVNVSWEEAEQIFERDSLPRFSKLTASAFGLTPTRLHPHCNGALLSIVFNRGSLIGTSSRRKEMAWIKSNIKIKKEERIPGNIKSMKRLWSYERLKGLHLRRDAEAALFQRGLKTSIEPVNHKSWIFHLLN